MIFRFFPIKKELQTLWKLLIVPILMGGCSTVRDFPQIEYEKSDMRNISCEVEAALNAAKRYFSFDPSVAFIYVVTPEKLLNTCGDNAVSCVYNYYSIVSKNNNTEYTCQQILHELGHIISYEKNGDLDREHKRYHDFYFGGYVSQSCANIGC